MEKKKTITIITGNKGKLAEFLALVGEEVNAKYNIVSKAIDL